MAWTYDDLPIRNRQVLDEANFMRRVVFAARSLDWLVHNTFQLKHAETGYPHLTMVREKRLIFAKFKLTTERPDDQQLLWLARLEQTGAEVYIWRPDQYTDILRILK